MSFNSVMYKTSLLTLWLLTLLSKNITFFNIKDLKEVNGPWKSLFRTIYNAAENVATLSIFIENKFVKKTVNFSDMEAGIKPIASKYDKNNDKDFKAVYDVDNLKLDYNNYPAYLNWMMPKDGYNFNLWTLAQNELQERLEAIYNNNDSRESNVVVNSFFTASSAIASSDMDYYFRHSCGGCCCCSCC